MFCSHFINGSASDQQYFWRYSNTLSRMKALSKKLYYQCEFQKSKTNPWMTWDIIRSAIPTKLDQRTPPSLEVNGSITDNPLLVRNKFIQFFCEIGLKLGNNITYGVNTHDPRTHLTKRISSSIYLDTPFS